MRSQQGLFKDVRMGKSRPNHSTNNNDTFLRFPRRLLHASPDKESFVTLENGSSHRSKKIMAWVSGETI